MSARKFSDFADAADSKPLDGDKVKIKDVVDILIEVKAYKVGASKFRKDGCGEYAIIQFSYADRDDKKNYIVTTGSGVLIRLLKKYEARLPFETTIVKIGEYFTFS